MPLSDLVDNVAEILHRWPAKPLLFRRDPTALSHLLTLEEVDSLIDTDCLAVRNCRLIRDSKVLERYEYANDGEDMPRPGAVRQHLTEGGSLSIRALETLKPSLAVLQRDIHEETGYLVHVNAYLTPAGCQGLKYHYDPYVTLIVQLHGSKTWPLHRPFVTNPVEEFDNFRVRGWTDEERHYLHHTPPTRSITLTPGDVMWLPRAWPHSPYTAGDDPSLHLTFALKERTLHWMAQQVARIICNHALADPAARAEIPPSELLGATHAPVKLVRDCMIGALLQLDEAATAITVRRAALNG